MNRGVRGLQHLSLSLICPVDADECSEIGFASFVSVYHRKFRSLGLQAGFVPAKIVSESLFVRSDDKS